MDEVPSNCSQNCHTRMQLSHVTLKQTGKKVSGPRSLKDAAPDRVYQARSGSLRHYTREYSSQIHLKHQRVFCARPSMHGSGKSLCLTCHALGQWSMCELTILRLADSSLQTVMCPVEVVSRHIACLWSVDKSHLYQNYETQ